VISHDREFLQGLSDKIFEFRDGKMKEFLETLMNIWNTDKKKA
jgi:ATPase subunit of ABC transporter with duplicated ATPase domains